MLIPRITAALTQHISPVSSSQAQTSVREKKQTPEERKKKREDERAPESTPHLKLVEPVDALEGDGEDDAPLEGPPPRAAPVPAKGPSVSSAFLQLLQFVQRKKGHVVRWFGSQSYNRNSRGQKKGTRFKKGTMLDHRVE